MATALIAEDEHLLAAALRAQLKSLWPELDVLAQVGDGQSALDQALALKPEVLFLDIRMPELSGIDVALHLADAWAADSPLPAIVFVTAYDEFALQAFEAQAIDYVLKPVQTERLAKTIARLKARLKARAGGSEADSQADDQADRDLGSTLAQLRALVDGEKPRARTPLRMLQVAVGNKINMIPIEDVLLFEATDKYVRVVTLNGRDYLIRRALKDLIAELDMEVFWQIHRGTLVRVSAIESVQKDEAGRQSLHLRGLGQALAVSRLYAHLFKAM